MISRFENKKSTAGATIVTNWCQSPHPHLAEGCGADQVPRKDKIIDVPHILSLLWTEYYYALTILCADITTYQLHLLVEESWGWSEHGGPHLLLTWILQYIRTSRWPVPNSCWFGGEAENVQCLEEGGYVK